MVFNICVASLGVSFLTPFKRKYDWHTLELRRWCKGQDYSTPCLVQSGNTRSFGGTSHYHTWNYRTNPNHHGGNNNTSPHAHVPPLSANGDCSMNNTNFFNNSGTFTFSSIWSNISVCEFYCLEYPNWVSNAYAQSWSIRTWSMSSAPNIDLKWFPHLTIDFWKSIFDLLYKPPYPLIHFWLPFLFLVPFHILSSYENETF